MLLVDQVELLRQNLVHLRTYQAALPLMGGLSATRNTYRFKSLIHPARDIATAIHNADPAGNKLPSHLRGWNLAVTDEYRKTRNVILKDLLGMVVHVYYLRIGDGDLDISNDRGQRFIVPYDLFLDSIERLVLTPENVCLVICGLAEQRLKTENRARSLETNIPGHGDLLHCLATIKRWPTLHDKVWKTFFAAQSTRVRADSRTVYDQPFLKGARLNGAIVMWHIGWRRNDAYSASWVDVTHLIRRIQDHFDRPHGKY